MRAAPGTNGRPLAPYRRRLSSSNPGKGSAEALAGGRAGRVGERGGDAPRADRGPRAEGEILSPFRDFSRPCSQESFLRVAQPIRFARCRRTGHSADSSAIGWSKFSPRRPSAVQRGVRRGYERRAPARCEAFGTLGHGTFRPCRSAMNDDSPEQDAPNPRRLVAQAPISVLHLAISNR